MQADNLLDALEKAAQAVYTKGTVSVVVPRQPVAPDAEVIFSHGSPPDKVGRDVSALDCVSAISKTDGRWHVKLADDQLACIGAALERGMPEILGLRKILDGCRWVVNFADPNTTKALHVGHLRNLALGHALASAAEAAGAFVLRQSRVGDIGRNMGEAMAGYARFGEDLTPSSAGMKGDVFIGRLYARYVRAEVGLSDERKPPDSTNAPLMREHRNRSDLAETLLRQWRANDSETLELFCSIRDWVLEGQESTLRRLGIAMDRTLYESDYMADAARLLQEALARRVAMRTADGAIIYDTGYDEYPYLLLAKDDGFPTQHLRYIATWDATRAMYADARTLSVVGSEWGPLTRHCDTILCQLNPNARVHPTDSVVHEMVTFESGVVKSSGGDVPLVDDLLDQLTDSQPLKELYERHDRAQLSDIVTAVALGGFLGRPKAQRFSFSFEGLLSTHNVGLTITRAWLSAWDAEHDGAADVELQDKDYRYALVLSQLSRRMLIPALDNLDLLAVARFYFHVARWFLSVPHTPRLSRVMRTVMDSAVTILGLFPVGEIQTAQTMR